MINWISIYGLFNKEDKLIGYVTDEEKAVKCCGENIDKGYYYKSLYNYDYFADKISIPMGYEFTVYCYMFNNEKFKVYCTEYDPYYCSDFLRPDSITFSKNHPYMPEEEIDGEILIMKVNVNKKSKYLAVQKVFCYINELVEHSNGRLDLDYIELMNIRFKQQRKQENERNGG